jgi:hypothetical protein
VKLSTNLNLISFPLVIDSASLTPERIYTFKLYTYLVDNPSAISICEIELTANSPPTSGSFTVTPESGDALSTEFDFSSTGWTDDVADFPLLYKFSYSQTPVSSVLDLSIFDERSLLSRILPSGNSNYDNLVSCSSIIQDALGASVQLYTFVEVTQVVLSVESSIELLGNLSDSLLSSLDSVDLVSVGSSINILASVLNTADCSQFTPEYCSGLQRSPCIDVSHYCGDCLDGYNGLPGPSTFPCFEDATSISRKLASNYTTKSINRKLFSSSASNNKNLKSISKKVPIGGFSSIGDRVEYDYQVYATSFEEDDDLCNFNSECPYGFCNDGGICEYFAKTCSSTNSSTVCSNNGECIFLDLSSNILLQCLATDTTCFSICVCNDGYSGQSCDTTIDVAESEEATREIMCIALGNMTELQDVSNSLVTSLSASLSQTFDAYTISNDGPVESCLSVLKAISLYTGDGYVDIATNETYNSIGYIISNFIESRKISEAKIWNRNISTTLEEIIAEDASSSYRPVTSFPRTGQWFKDFISVDRYPFIAASIKLLIQGIQYNMIAGQNPISVNTENINIEIYYDSLESLYDRELAPPLSTTEQLYNLAPSVITLPTTGLDSCMVTGTFGQILLSVSKYSFSPYPNSDKIITPLLMVTTAFPFDSLSTGSSAPPAERGLYDNPKTFETYSIFLSFMQPQKWIEFDGVNSSFPSCAKRNTNVYSHCLTKNTSNYNTYNVSFDVIGISSLCPSNSISRRRLSSLESVYEDTGNAMYDILDSSTASTEHGVVAEILVGKVITLLLYSPNIYIISFMGSCFVIVIIGLFAFDKWDRFDKYQLQKYNLGKEKLIKKSSSKKNNKIDKDKRFQMDWNQFSRRNLTDIADYSDDDIDNNLNSINNSNEIKLMDDNSFNSHNSSKKINTSGDIFSNNLFDNSYSESDNSHDNSFNSSFNNLDLSLVDIRKSKYNLYNIFFLNFFIDNYFISINI